MGMLGLVEAHLEYSLGGVLVLADQLRAVGAWIWNARDTYRKRVMDLEHTDLTWRSRLFI